MAGCLFVFLLALYSVVAEIPVIQKIGTTFNCLQFASASDLEIHLSSVKAVLTTTGLGFSDFILMNKFNKTLEGDIFPTTSIGEKRVCIAGYFANH